MFHFACGERPGHEDGPAAEARFGSSIKSIACLANCSVLVGDAGTGRLRFNHIADYIYKPVLLLLLLFNWVTVLS